MGGSPEDWPGPHGPPKENAGISRDEIPSKRDVFSRTWRKKRLKGKMDGPEGVRSKAQDTFLGNRAGES